MTDEELIARLRRNGQRIDHGINELCDDAADRIEALTKERDDYAHKLMQSNNTYTEMHLEIERLRDKREKAVKEMDRIIAELKGESHD